MARIRTVYEFTISAGRLRALLEPHQAAPSGAVLRFILDGENIAVEEDVPWQEDRSTLRRSSVAPA